MEEQLMLPLFLDRRVSGKLPVMPGFWYSAFLNSEHCT
jgi:hypothetical protein